MRAWWMALGGLAGVYGAAGVGLAAAGAHRGGGPLVATAADLLLLHAAAIVAFCAIARGEGRALLVAGALLALGALLFCGELALHGLTGRAPLPLAAPTGGVLMIAGWLVGAIAMPIALYRLGREA